MNWKLKVSCSVQALKSPGWLLQMVFLLQEPRVILPAYRNALALPPSDIITTRAFIWKSYFFLQNYVSTRNGNKDIARLAQMPNQTTKKKNSVRVIPPIQIL
jgi:hypothetical protein